MIHIKKIILTLALLIAATTQAWAGEIFTTLKVGDVIHIGDQFSFSEDWGYENWYISSHSSPFTLMRANLSDYDPNAAETQVTLDEDGAYYVFQSYYDGEFFYFGAHNVRFPATANSDGLVVTSIFTLGNHKEYTFAVHEAYPVPVAWNADTKTGTIASMPSGNVTVSVKYYQQAEFTAGGAPAAVEGVLAKTGAPLVTGGTVANIGTSDVKQGKVMYYAKQKSGETVPTAPTYDSEGWSEAVPTAATFSEGDVYVWYYIAGAEPASGTARSDANTCSDSDIKRLTVTLDAAPTYDVVINTAGLSAEEAGKWSASPNTGVKKGDEVTVTYTGTRKVIGVKAEKIDNNYMKWDDSQKKLVPTEIPATATKVENPNDYLTLSAGTYLVEGDVTISGTVYLSGDVELIIKDGAKLNANRIFGNVTYSLSVYGQAKMSGELNVACSYSSAINDMTVLKIHSCKLNASSSRSLCCAISNITAFNIYGGSVNAEYTGDGTGCGMKLNLLNIYGGDVKTVGKGINATYSYGINNSNGTTVNVYGGKLWAECAGNRAINSNVTLKKDEGYTTGKIETSADGTSWVPYNGTGTPDAKYVRVGY